MQRHVRHWQAYQHIYLALLYGLLAIKSIILDDFQSISTGSIGPVSISKLTRQEKTIFWGGKLLWLAYFMVLPAVKSHHSWGALAALWLISEAVTGWILALMFQVTATMRCHFLLCNTFQYASRSTAGAGLPRIQLESDFHCTGMSECSSTCCMLVKPSGLRHTAHLKSVLLCFAKLFSCVHEIKWSAGGSCHPRCSLSPAAEWCAGT